MSLYVCTNDCITCENKGICDQNTKNEAEIRKTTDILWELNIDDILRITQINVENLFTTSSALIDSKREEESVKLITEFIDDIKSPVFEEKIQEIPQSISYIKERMEKRLVQLIERMANKIISVIRGDECAYKKHYICDICFVREKCQQKE